MKNLKLRKQIALEALVAFLAITASAVTIERFISYQRWNLYENGNWVSSKSLVENFSGLMGNFPFLMERQALAQGHLHLSEWHGFQELSYNKAIDLKTLKIKFKLEPKAYLWIFFDESAHGRKGIRVSRNPNYPSGVFELGPQRQIKLLEPIESNENLNRLKIQLDPQESKKFLLSLNSNLSIEIQKTSLDKTFITLRSGEHDVEVYRLSIRGENSFYSEDFAPPPSFSMILFFILLITGTAFLLWRKNKREFKFASHAFALSLPLFTFSLTLIFLDQKYYVSKYYYKGYTPHNRFSDKGEVADFENFRSRLFFTYKKELPKIPTPAPGLEKTLGIESDLSHHKRESIEWMNTQNGSQQFKKIFHLQKEAHSHPDVLFFGASQTWGAGAPQNQKSWTNLLLSKISDQVKRPVTGLNIAACGTTTLSAKPNLTQALEVTSPAIVLLNIGINDDRIYPDEVYAKELNEIIDQIESNGALPIFSLEPDNFETRNGATLRSHEIIRSIAREREIPLIDSRGHFLSPHVRDSGLLFWDIVHFDSWGHHTMANFIFESYPWAQRLKVQ